MTTPNRRLKPLPKRGDEGIQEQITPYYVDKGPDTSVYAKNRGNDLSQKSNKDTTKDFAVSIKDIDESILYYFEKVIRPTVIQNGVKVNVPIRYGDQELWKTIQNDGYLRDKDGKLMAPIIMFKRDSIQKNRDLGNKLDANKAHLYEVFEKKYNKWNQYDNFSVLNNRIPVKEFVATIVPDYVTVSYSCVIFTSFVEQMNPIIEAINYASDAYWGDLKRFRFRAKIDSFTTLTEVVVGKDRVVKSTFNVILNGYIIPDAMIKDLGSIKKFFSKAQIVFDFETTAFDPSEKVIVLQNESQNLNTDPRILIENSQLNVRNFTEINNITIFNSSSISDLNYVNANIEKKATAVNINNATFSNTAVLQPPVGSLLPPTDKTDFEFFINGQYVPQSAVTQINQIGNTVNVTFDTTILQYTLETDDEVIGIGKFMNA